MKEKQPQPISIPTIERDRQHPPVLLDMEIDPLMIESLLNQMSNGRTPQLRKIKIEGGSLQVRPRDISRSITISLDRQQNYPNVFPILFLSSVQLGHCSRYRKVISLFPDSIFLSYIANEITENSNFSSSPNLLNFGRNSIDDTSQPNFNDYVARLKHRSAIVLVHEAEHSFQTTPSSPRHLYEFWIKGNKNIIQDQKKLREEKAQNQQLQEDLVNLAMNGITLNPLISEQKFIDLYQFAQETFTSIAISITKHLPKT